MPREIKFRAWDGHRFVSPDNYHLDLHGNIWWEFGYNEPKLVKKEDLVLMQFTGLKDKNGVEIYEGDICRDKDWGQERRAISIVEYQAPSFILRKPKSTRWYEWCAVVDQEGSMVEVIGNIYENPELLERSKC